jgi:peptidyl-prolyl cis-trans isomerase C
MRKVILALGLLASATAGAAGNNDSDTLVVSQGTARVTLGDVDAYVHRIPETDRSGFMSKPDRIETMLRNMLLDKQLASEARELDIDKDPIVQRQIALAVDNALSRARVDRLRESLKAPDFTEQAREEYQANKQKYMTPKRYDVKHILFALKYGSPEMSRTPEEAEVLAKEAAEKLKRDPSQFDSLVESLSDDQSKKDNHGLIENATSESFVKPFAEAAAKLQNVGEISPPVKTVFGYHLLKLVKSEPAQQQPFDRVSQSIVSRLSAEWMEAQIRGHLDNLRNQTMDPKPEVLATLRERYNDPAAANIPPTIARPAANDAAPRK